MALRFAMSFRHARSLTAALALAAAGAWVGPVHADETKAQPAPASVKPDASQTKAGAKAALLGVATYPAPPELAERLKLPEGFGVLVEHVQVDGPAAKAGVVAGDVIHKLGDQLITSPQHLSTLVRSHKPGDKVSLALFRDGRSKILDIALGERDIHDLAPPAQPGQPQPQPRKMRFPGGGGATTRVFQDAEHRLTLSEDEAGKRVTVADRDGKVLFEGPVNTPEERLKMPKDALAKLEKLEQAPKLGAGFGRGMPEFNWDGEELKLREMLRENLKAFKDGAEDGGERLEQAIEKMRKQIEERVEKAMRQHRLQGARPGQPQGPGPQGQAPLVEERFDFQSSANMSDGEHTLSLRADKVGKHLHAKDKAGKTLFDGPINTPEERNKVPADLRPKLEMLEKSIKIELPRHPAPQPERQPKPAAPELKA